MEARKTYTSKPFVGNPMQEVWRPQTTHCGNTKER